MRRTVALAVLAVLPLLCAERCTASDGETLTKDCSISYVGLSVHRGRVIDVVRPTCDKPPQEHTMKVELEIRVGGEWVPQGRAAVRDTPPDRAGYRVEVTATCVEGEWHTNVYVQGVGPNGDPFEYTESGRTRHFSLVECAG